ncbi:MAG: Na+/H+ antiporter NhaC family protein [Lachnospiraceae bacterium]|nr:Na+/H+ antiporter NhaC family protein [Lachnospiraceae bacterium]
MFTGTAFSLLPPLLAIILALITKQVYLSLFAGVVLGSLMMGNFQIFPSLEAFYKMMTENFDVSIILFLIVLSMDIVLIQKSGAAGAYSRWASARLKTKRASMLATFLLGILIFVDDGFNCLTIGTVMRPVTDRYKVSRARLAYIIDATAAPVCIIAPVSSWAAAINSYVPAGAGISGFQLFMKTIPYNLYALLTIFMVFFTSAADFQFGLMKKYDDRAAAGDLGAPKENDANQKDQEENEQVTGHGARLIDMVLPMVMLIVASVGFMFYTGYKAGGRTLVECFANCSSAESLFLAALLVLVFLCIYYPARKIWRFSDIMEIIPEGAKLMIPFMIILVLAWTLKGTIGALGAGEFIATIMNVNGSLAHFIPVLAFAIAVFISFSSGTSWGTFAIMVPLVIGLFSGSSNLSLMTVSVSAVLSGAVCGDHISPISDTTIMSSSGALCRHLEHVQSQIQYAIPVIISCFVGFLISGFTESALLSLVASLAFLLLILFGIKRKTA